MYPLTSSSLERTDRKIVLSETMMMNIRVLNLYFLLQLMVLSSLSEAKLSVIQPQSAKNFNITYIQRNSRNCSYRVEIITSCSSPKYTRDAISISFGDAYGNQIYWPRLDDPGSDTFERCSSDTYTIEGPCANRICYLYLYRTGPDGWKPESVVIYGFGFDSVRFYYNTFLPSDVWFGFNYCSSASSTPSVGRLQFLVVLLVGIVFVLLV